MLRPDCFLSLLFPNDRAAAPIINPNETFGNGLGVVLSHIVLVISSYFPSKLLPIVLAF